jgi:glutamate dehydrogenase
MAPGIVDLMAKRPNLSPTRSGHSTPGRQPSPNPTHLKLPTRCQRRSIQDDGSGYISGAFAGKEKQMDEVMDALDEKGFIPTKFVEQETHWFYDDLGIDDM